MSNDKHEVVVIGAGPAGATAAILLAKQGHRAAIVERSTFPLKETYTCWLNTRAAALLDELGVAAEPLLNRPFHNVTFHSADFSKTAKPNFEQTPGYLIDRAEFSNALVEAISAAGVTLVQGSAASDIRLTETSALVTLADGGEVEGRLLMLAAGNASPLLDRCGFDRSGTTAPIWLAQVDAPPKKRSDASEPQVDVVLGLDRGGSFGVCCAAGGRLSVAVNWLGEREAAVPALINLCRTAFEHKVIPLEISTQAATAEVVRSPASEALDMDTHVGKHTLLLGDAGGFIAAASNEGIYPAMWSAQIAAEVADAALSSVHSQDELMAFDSSWRIQMADYLRSPNTDIQFLLPLIFSNQPTADRMGAAFFAGETI
jgi:flavin-dependent dehydrogenase